MNAELRWLSVPRPSSGVTWGVPWPRGAVPIDTPFGLGDVPVQSWVTATWPDGSVKWSAHAIGPSDADSFVLTLDKPAVPARPVQVGRSPLTVDTGVVRWVVPGGDVLLTSDLVRDVRLVRVGQEAPPIDEVVVEQDGPVRAVVRLTGRDFVVRLYFYAGASDVRIVHTFIYENPVAGLGLRADVPMRDEPHDRHVRLAGPTGFLTEAVRGITGLRRDPGARFRAAQIAGRACGPVSEWDSSVARRVQFIPQWNDWTLDQNSADGFTLRKRTGRDHGWVTIPSSTRSAGYGYVGGARFGGLGFGLRDFWQSYPTRLDIRNAATDLATATVWLWSPSAPPMDLRFYHDGLGQDTYASQLEGLEITYEDYEPGFGDPYGIARTHELVLRAYSSTPSADELWEHACALNDPGLLVASPAHLRSAGVFGDWSLVDRSTPARAEIEDRLDFLFDFYVGQREQRRWYGFWDYGDVMHAYDPDRHQWRYDIGGYAWDNSELSPDLFFWYQFLRTGRPGVFRFAEAMTRHTGEVDVYHRGRWKGLGTRHNVQHWGCSAKQLRISSAIYRRVFYYLTADERTGDLLHELADAEHTFLAIDPTRKVRSNVYSPHRNALSVGLGTDWGALAAAWLTEWERFGDERARAKLLGTMHDIGQMPHGFLTGEALFDLDTGRFDTTRDRISVSHLSAVFGLVEVCSELIALAPDAGFERAWLDYCSLYLASPEEQERAVGRPLQGISLIQAHSRLAAYAAARTGSERLARLAWRAFRQDVGDQINTNRLQRQTDWRLADVSGPTVLAPVQEAPFISTNDAAQYGLAAIQNLALIGEWLG